MNATGAVSDTVSPWRHARAIVLLPLTNTLLIPAAILLATGSPVDAAGLEAWSVTEVLRTVTGAALFASGVVLVVGVVTLFVRQGEGTIAPWDPPRVFIADGGYRYCRHPMKLGLFLTLFGEAVLLGSLPLSYWSVCFVAANALYVPLHEEPALRRRFGRSYVDYCKQVPRWLPRRCAWRGLGAAQGDIA
jgi:protein-S-isoprenylcysteine O-methyltransferase Ste14